jgi:hypothetical protein
VSMSFFSRFAKLRQPEGNAGPVSRNISYCCNVTVVTATERTPQATITHSICYEWNPVYAGKLCKTPAARPFRALINSRDDAKVFLTLEQD